ncbi:unnamed protein product [Urochloa decumbens]|uniref:F-box domain-containing protein n=1 Tax=Urochloa decumbens TaxID=240449 RepID=A0ABC8WA84_9POAL
MAASSTAHAHRIAGDPAAQPALRDELLKDIFLRLDEAADLARGSVACTTFRRVVSARPFLRRYRSLHAPPVLGGIVAEIRRFQPAEPPHRSAPAARAVARAADFTFSFLPKPNRWSTRDIRDGRVLRSSPRPPPRSTASCSWSATPCTAGSLDLEFEPFLAPANEEEKESSSFRVICNVLSGKEVVTFIFSSATEQWQHVNGTLLTRGNAKTSCKLFVRHYVHNCFYWTHPHRSDLLVLDMGEMKFSFVDLPPKTLAPPFEVMKRAIVELGEGRLGLLTLDRSCVLELYWRDSGVDAQEWQYSKAIPIPNCDGGGCLIIGRAEGHALILQPGFLRY